MLADKTKFSATLRDKRLTVKLTQQQVASRLHIGVKTYVEWEAPESDLWPNLAESYQLAKLLQTTPWALLDEAPPVYSGEPNSDEKKRKIIERLLSDPDFFLFCHAAAGKHSDVIKAALLYWNAENLHSGD